MANWIPRKVLADEGLRERLPTALDAWVRFAGRKAGTAEWAVKATRNAIPRWRDEMVDRGSDPASGGPAKQFLTAAKGAGVDVEDGDAQDVHRRLERAQRDLVAPAALAPADDGPPKRPPAPCIVP